MRNKILFACIGLASIFCVMKSTPLEARSRHHVQVGVRAERGNAENCVVRRYVQRPPQPVCVPVPVNRAYYNPYYAPTTMYLCPAPAPTTVIEEVHVKPARPNIFSGFSFSWFFG